MSVCNENNKSKCVLPSNICLTNSTKGSQESDIITMLPKTEIFERERTKKSTTYDINIFKKLDFLNIKRKKYAMYSAEVKKRCIEEVGI